MNQLEKARQDIERIDAGMAKLFEERMKAAEQVAAYKKEQGLPIEDRVREEALIRKNSGLVAFEYRPYYAGFLTHLMEESKNYQRRLLEGMAVAYSGVEGAFAHLAAGRIFPSGTLIPCPDFESAYRAVEDGRCDCAVLPIENSYAGDVDSVLDLAYRGSLSVAGIYHMPLSQSLLAKPGVSIDEIREVQSHPQALSQCMPYLKSRGWKLSPTVNTAVAAKEVAGGARRDLAVIAARETAELYGLSVLAGEINENKNNTTRFAVFTRAECTVAPEDQHFLLLFTTKNAPGALGHAISIISEYGYNLRCLKSRPTGQENWAYYFYAEGEGNVGTDHGRQMIQSLEEVCKDVRLLGSFREEKLLEDRRKER